MGLTNGIRAGTSVYDLRHAPSGRTEAMFIRRFDEWVHSMFQLWIQVDHIKIDMLR
jgi:hypothetical protein